MEASRYLDPGFWASEQPAAPGAALPGDAADPAGLVWFRTSGTGGGAKWIGHTREALLLSAAMVNRHLGVAGDEVWGLALPLCHVGGFGVGARAFESGARLAAWPGGWDPEAFTRWLGSERVAHLSLVPTQVHDLAAAGLAAPPCLRTLVVGGGRLDETAGRRARALGWPVLASYGMTEAGSQIATQPPDLLDGPYESGPLPVLPQWTVRSGPGGRLELAGPCLFAATLETTPEGSRYRPRHGDRFVTGDLVEMEGNRLRVTGRADRLVKILGELVNPDEVAARLELDPARSAVVARPDPRRGANLVLVTEGESPDLERYNAGVPGPWRIDGVVRRRELPRTALGKLRVAEIARRLEAGEL